MSHNPHNPSLNPEISLFDKDGFHIRMRGAEFYIIFLLVIKG